MQAKRLFIAVPIMTIVAMAEGVAQERSAVQSDIVVVELFSSQACASCVAAADMISDLAGRDDVVALSWHVDYWNMRETKNGRWEDPYSDEVCTARQRKYNKNIRGRSSVYTPQLVVNGTQEDVGSSQQKIDDMIVNAKRELRAPNISSKRSENTLTFNIGTTYIEAEAILVNFKPMVETKITHGENAGIAYKDANVVTKMHVLGSVGVEGGMIAAVAPPPGEHCAIILQEPNQGAIITAQYCPEA